MTALDVWLRDLLPRTPGLLPEVAVNEVRLAARDFFARSYIWRETVGPLELTATVGDYVPAPADPVESEVFSVIDVEYENSLLRPIMRRPLGPEETGKPRYWYATLPGQCTLWPTPSATEPDALLFTVALMPTIAAETLPDFVSQSYYDVILDGALGRIFSHPSKPYSNPMLAGMHAKRARMLTAQATAQAKTGNNNTQLWRYPPFA